MRNSYLVFLIISLVSCNTSISKKEAWSIGLTPCNGRPAYIENSPINSKNAALSTSERKLKGLALIDIQTHQTWQHPSWSKFGSMGPIATDKSGNSYIAPVPVINVLDNQPGQQNYLYKVDGQTAEMKKFMELPFNAPPNDENPYGLIGLHFDCHADLLFASSLMGSTSAEEKGIIFIIDIKEEKVLDKIENTDAMGMAVCGVTGQKRLYFGSCRNSNIYSIEVGKNNSFIDSPILEFSLDMLGPRGDDKARKIIFKPDGTLIVKGIAFDYNLTAPTEKLETQYSFVYDRSVKKWVFQQVVY